MLLGFRKERLAELESALRQESIDFAKVFLAPLDVEGIQDTFWGPVHNERLAAKYGLTIEDQLPEIVAHDLTADPDSPVAPTLNILLAQAVGSGHGTECERSTFQRNALRATASRRHPARRLPAPADCHAGPGTARLPSSSGFVTDLWALHTTDLGTADQCSADELQAVYTHRPDLDAVVLRSKELYVLADLPGDSAEASTASGTRLAHDTLAPLVRRDYDHSVHPGQQARRLLESRVVDWSDGRTGTLLDDSALALVDKGLAGMRSLSADEQRLLSASRQAQAQRHRQRRFWQTAAAAAAVTILGLLAIALFLWNNQQVATRRERRRLPRRSSRPNAPTGSTPNAKHRKSATAAPSSTTNSPANASLTPPAWPRSTSRSASPSSPSSS